MKRLICLALALLFVSAGFSGCASVGDDTRTDIVCTVFPIYDWLRNIIGEGSGDITLTLLVKNGTDPHSYTPSPADIAKISSCDLLVYVGGESDAWVTDVLGGEVNKDMKVVKLLEVLGDRALISDVEGAEHAHDSHEEHAENAYDEHVWLSLKNAAFLCEKLSDILCAEIPEHAESYKGNAEKYINDIRALDARYEESVASSARDTLLFADRFPFGYLVEDYNLKYFAAFSGCSADSEASFGTVSFLAKKLDELSLEYVIILENSDTALADTVISSSKERSAKILVIDSMQSINAADIESDISYLDVMEKNLAVIETALA